MTVDTAVADAIDQEVLTRATGRFGGKYLSLTTYRRDGTPVATPVWFVWNDGTIYVQTDADSGKVKRIRNDPRVTVAPCSATGKLRADPLGARAEILPDPELADVRRMIAQKYRFDLIFIKPVRALQRLFKRAPKSAEIALAILPD